MVLPKFMDMHSGGNTKEGDYNYIYIEATEEEAKIIFQNRFGHNPDRVSCTCCGKDYSTSESESLEQVTAYERNCRYVGHEYIEEPDTKYDKSRKLITLENYCKLPNVLIIRKEEIKPEERKGNLRVSGYVWVE